MDLIALAVIGAALFAAFVGGIAYARRAMRRDPEGFARNVLLAKTLTAAARARWEDIVKRSGGGGGPQEPK